jgi:hypothetical protein
MDQHQAEWARLSVAVPKEHYGELLEEIGRFIRERIGLVTVVGPAGLAEAAPWTSDDVKEAVHVYSQLSTKARQVFDLLMDNEDEAMAGDYLAEQFDLGNKFGVAGTFAWPGRYSAAVGRKFPVSWNSTNGSYWMTSEVAGVFRKAREQVQAAKAS